MERGRKKQNVFLGVLIFIGIAVIFAILYFLSKQDEEMIVEEQSQSSLESVFYNGEEYIYNSDLMNILFLGIDNYDMVTENEIPGEAGQSDCIMLITLDKTTKQASVLQIPRDTMTTIDLYDVNGNAYTTVTEQIATQYAYGIGGQHSCFAAKQTISELLYDLPIDGYISLDMASISIINDAIGGVTITFDEDYTYVDEAFTQGTTMTLDGDQAYDFVHYRDVDEAFSNNGRMHRQTKYISALLTAIKDKVRENENLYSIVYPLVEDYMLTDLREDQINEMAEYDLNESAITYLPGEGAKGEIYEEFYVDEEKLQELIIRTFYNLKK